MVCVLLVALALLTRGLYLEDGVALLYTPEQDGTRMARRYDESALSILGGDGILFPREWDKARTGLLSRPPGYATFLAAIYATFGRSFSVAAAVQDVLTSLSVVLVFAFGFRLAGFAAASFAALLVAVSPHIASSSNLILADAIAPIPLLLAFLVALPVMEGKSSRETLRFAVMGLLIGAGTWLRPNVLALGPFAALFVFFLLGRTKRAAIFAGLMAFVSLLAVAPITLRNWLVFGEFVPVSINGGITLWQGVGDAGGQEYGARVWDKQVMAEEAERYHRPDYLLWWAEPDGIARDRDRYRRAMEVIKERPWWYAKTMLRRMGEMLLFTDGPTGLLPSGAILKAPPSERIPLPPSPGLDAAIDDETLARRLGVASLLRAPLRALHGIWWLVPVLVWVGVALSLRRRAKTVVFWLIVPAYYLVFESPFHYEWRVAVPMQYFLLPFAAVALARATELAGRRVSKR